MLVLESFGPCFVVLSAHITSAALVVIQAQDALTTEVLSSSSTHLRGVPGSSATFVGPTATTTYCASQVFQASHPGRRLRVYNLRYASSLEADKYAAALSREQRAFEDLIASKRHMVLPDLAADMAALSQQPAALAHDGGPLLLTHPGVDTGGAIISGGSGTNSLTRRAGEACLLPFGCAIVAVQMHVVSHALQVV